jgi:hypothetical protein
MEMAIFMLQCCHTTTYFITTYFTELLTIVTLARPKYRPPDDGHRPKQVAAF